MVAKNTHIFIQLMSQARTEITANGIHITLRVRKKSRSIESFTSSGLIHL